MLIKEIKILFVYHIFLFLNLSFATCLAYVDKPNMIWYNLNGFFSLLLLSYFFHSSVSTKRLKKSIFILSVVSLLAYVVLLYRSDNDGAFFSLGYGLISITIIIFCLLYIRNDLIYKTAPSGKDVFLIAVVCSILINNLGSFLIYITYRFLTLKFYAHQAFGIFVSPGTLWGIHNIIFFLSSMVIAFSILKFNCGDIHS